MLTPAEVSQSLQSWRKHVCEALPLLRERQYSVPDKSDCNCAVFVDSQKSQFTEFAIRNIMHFLGPGWDLKLCVSEKSWNWFKLNLADWRSLTVDPIIIPSGVDEVGYVNRLMRKEAFWRSFSGENIFIFDSSSLMRKPLADKYLDYCYIGSPWPEEKLSIWCRVGDGRLSLRKKSSMIDLITRCNTKSHLIEREDVFFSITLHLEPDRYNVADPVVASAFSVEQIPHPDPVCLHQAWKYLDRISLNALLETIRY